MKEKIKKLFAKKANLQKMKGQSLVEITMTLPILLILLSGLVEFGFMLNYYLAITDASREVARITSNWSHTYIDPVTDNTFYEVGVAKVIYALEPDDANDTTRKVKILENRVNCPTEKLEKGVCDNEIIISVYSIGEDSSVLVESHHWDDTDIRQESRFSAAVIQDRLADIDSTNAGAVVVEIFYNYEQVLGLPWLEMVPDPFLLYAYTVMPLSSAEPEID